MAYPVLKTLLAALFAVSGVLGFVENASALTLLRTTLTGSQEVPPNDSPAIGFGTFTLNDAQTELAFQVSYSGLIGGSTTFVSHFHNAPPGVAGPIVRHVSTLGAGYPDGFLSGVWSVNDPALASGDPNRGPLTPFLVSELLNGRIYFNIHTSDGVLPDFPGGEIRGQLAVISEPSGFVLLSLGALSLVGYRARRSQRMA